MVTKKTSRGAPWTRPNPATTHTHLTPEQIATAKAAAEKAGRRYPNLVDNMRVAAAAKHKTAKKTSGS